MIFSSPAFFNVLVKKSKNETRRLRKKLRRQGAQFEESAKLNPEK